MKKKMFKKTAPISGPVIFQLVIIYKEKERIPLSLEAMHFVDAKRDPLQDINLDPRILSSVSNPTSTFPAPIQSYII